MNPVFGPEMDAALRELTARIEAESSELKGILEESRKEGGTEAEILRRLLEVIAKDPLLAGRIEAAATEAFALVREPRLPAAPTHSSLVLPPREGGFGLPRLDPLYEAALQERLQFDGDAPELRSGPISRGVAPAVPVDTDARDPVAIGWMLEKASEEVAEEFRAIEGDAVKEVERLTGSEDHGEIAVREEALLAKIERSNLPEPAGYARGSLPTPRKVESPEGWGLASLTSEQRGQLAWKFLSTTQGRRTATKALRELVAVGLRSDGVTVTISESDSGRVNPDDVLAHAEWVVDIAGPNATQSSFAFVDVAAKVLIRKLEGALGARDASGAVLEVIPVSAVDVRKVGWAARLLQRAS